jgi:hypothetical protein
LGVYIHLLAGKGVYINELPASVTTVHTDSIYK